MARECVVCLGDEEEDTPLLQLPCKKHYVCPSECLESYFRQAINNEKSYPPQCCEAVLLLSEFEESLPFDVTWEYMRKEIEYSVPARLRVFCASASCHQFLPRDSYETEAGVVFAKCSACSAFTCTICKNVLLENLHQEYCNVLVPAQTTNGTDKMVKCQNKNPGRRHLCAATILTAVNKHKCEVSEEDKKFKATAKEKGYQECKACGSTVELAEACNHITCECGNQFCYVCGRAWENLSYCVGGCPRYGPAVYDDDGYNEDGFHKDTGLDRNGLTARDRWGEGDDDDEDNRDDDDEDEDDELERELDIALLDAETRQFILNMDPDERAMALAEARFHAAARGELVLGEGQAAGAEEDDGDEEAEDAEGDDQEGELDEAPNAEDDGAAPGDADDGNSGDADDQQDDLPENQNDDDGMSVFIRDNHSDILGQEVAHDDGNDADDREDPLLRSSQLPPEINALFEESEESVEQDQLLRSSRIPPEINALFEESGEPVEQGNRRESVASMMSIDPPNWGRYRESSAFQESESEDDQAMSTPDVGLNSLNGTARLGPTYLTGSNGDFVVTAIMGRDTTYGPPQPGAWDGWEEEL